MTDRIIIITGASSGIGAALARTLAGQVGGMVLHCRSARDKLEAVAREVSSQGTPTAQIFGDLGNHGIASQIVDAAAAQFGRIDCVVANAGFPILKSFSDGTQDDIEFAFRANLFSFFELARAAHGYLKKAPDPRLVAVGSFTAHVFRNDIRQFPISAASKGGLETAVRSLAAAMSTDGITVNCIVPGFIRKEQGTKDGIPDKEQLATQARIPLGRFGEPSEVAAAIAFLLSKEAGYITGQSLHVNGGLV
jgi:3-oxoacyl-[acyl-carrier protein] reductase